MTTYEPTLSVQKALRARLIASDALVSLVPPSNIAVDDRRPEAMPAILIGADHIVEGDYEGEQYFSEVFADLHIWDDKPSLSSVKEIAGVIKTAIKASPLIAEGFRINSVKYSQARFMHDSDGTHGHGVVTIEVILQPVA